MFNECNGTERPQAPGAQAGRGVVEGQFFAALDAIGEERLDVGQCERCCQYNARLRGSTADFRDCKEWLALQWRAHIDARAATIRKQESTTAATAFRDPVWVRQG